MSCPIPLIPERFLPPSPEIAISVVVVVRDPVALSTHPSKSLTLVRTPHHRTALILLGRKVPR